MNNLDFEKASIFRDRIKSLNIIQSSQRINEANLVDADVMLHIKSLAKHVFKYFFIDQNKIGEIKLIFQNMILIKIFQKLCPLF